MGCIRFSEKPRSLRSEFRSAVEASRLTQGIADEFPPKPLLKR